VLATNRRTVVVLVHGGAIDVSALLTTQEEEGSVPGTGGNGGVPAILDGHYAGQMGGDAIMRTLLNYQGAAPAGRLTTTVYRNDFTTLRNMTDMSMHNITYKHYTGNAVFPFGWGLSYSRFQVTWANSDSSDSTADIGVRGEDGGSSDSVLPPSKTVNTTDMLESHAEYFAARARGDLQWASPAAYSAVVTNVGNITSDFVLLGFISSPARVSADPQEPLRELFDFARVRALAPGISANVTLSVPAAVMSHVDDRGNERLRSGNYVVQLGGRWLGDEGGGLRAQLRLVGEDQMLFSLQESQARYEQHQRQQR